MNNINTTQELIKITIDLGNGNAENILVQEGEQNSYRRLAKEFCQKHGFDDQIEEALAD